MTHTGIRTRSWRQQLVDLRWVWVTVVAAGCLSACGETVKPLGVLVNEAGVSKERVGPTAVDPASVGYVSADSLLRVRRGNVVGDAAVDTITEMPKGQGIEVRDGTTGSVSHVRTDDYLTAFDVIAAAGDRQNVVLYTYPNSAGGGTLSIVQVPGAVVVSSWSESPAPSGGVGVSDWRGEPSIFYILGDSIVVRSRLGQRLGQMVVPGAHAFTRVFPSSAAGRTVVVASGDGYTPYHMVVVFDAEARIVYHEQAREHAFQLTVAADGRSFDVDTRSDRWRYRLP